MKDNFTYNNPPQMADYGLNENDFHHCGEDVNDEDNLTCLPYKSCKVSKLQKLHIAKLQEKATPKDG